MLHRTTADDLRLPGNHTPGPRDHPGRRNHRELLELLIPLLDILQSVPILGSSLLRWCSSSIPSVRAQIISNARQGPRYTRTRSHGVSGIGLLGARLGRVSAMAVRHGGAWASRTRRVGGLRSSIRRNRGRCPGRARCRSGLRAGGRGVGVSRRSHPPDQTTGDDQSRQCMSKLHVGVFTSFGARNVVLVTSPRDATSNLERPGLAAAGSPLTGAHERSAPQSALGNRLQPQADLDLLLHAA
jgi:hypothetical protein